MRAYALTVEARANLLAIIDFIASDNPAAAERVLAEFTDAFQRLAATPGIGHYRVKLLDRSHRFHALYSYLIVYRWQASPIQIVAIVHARRDLESYFAERGIG